MKTVELWKLTMGMDEYFFSDYPDAVGALAAMIRGAKIYTPCEPGATARVGLKPVEARISKVEMPASQVRSVLACIEQGRRQIRPRLEVGA